MQFQLEQSQWWSPAELAAAQDRQLDALLAHTAATVPFYRERWQQAGIDLRRATSADIGKLPIVSRRQIQSAGGAVRSTAPPAGHGTVHEDQTSGSLGMPLRFCATETHGFFWQALTLRDHLWHRRDFSAKLAAIRYSVPHARHENWGGLLSTALRTGPAVSMPTSAGIEAQLEWLVAEDPAYLLAYPSNLRGLARLSLKRGIALPSLRQVRSFGEVMPEQTRALIDAAWKVPVVDAYSAQEAGYLALQCPQAGGYHVMAENVRVEVLNADGTPSRPGEIGQVVVTTLHNFAYPLIRYALGDYAEVGDACPCGRGLQRLNRIVGRERNLIVLPDGRRIWPVFGIFEWGGEVPVSAHRLVQKTAGRLSYEYVGERPLLDSERERITGSLHRLHPDLQIDFEPRDTLAAGPNGKFEDVVCLLDDA